MAKARSILKRVKAVRSTRTITKTMEMISTARFKRAHNRVLAARPYTDTLQTIVAQVVAALEGQAEHPLLAAGPKDKPGLLLIMTANRGLCGGYNSSVLRRGLEKREELTRHDGGVLLQVVGKRGQQALKFRKLTVEKAYTQFDWMPQYSAVAALADELIARFIDGQIASLDVAYMQFVSAGRQRPEIMRLLPLTVEQGQPALAEPKAVESERRSIYEFVPSASAVLEKLLPSAVRLGLYQACLDASVSEQIARMTSMRSATENADEMMHSLTVRYNRMRQSQITTELAEIMGGRAGLEE